MKAKIILFLFWISLGLAITHQPTYAAYSDNQNQGNGRYALLVPSGLGTYTKNVYKKSPALVLDTYQGIVWKCPDLQDEKLRWLKTDLANNPAAGLRTKYVGIISDLSSNELKISAVVLDAEEGKTWVCPDISSEDSKWQLTVLVEKPKPAPERTGIWE